ncbi:hypothetical protein LWI28_021608 [Acer negundo]|uniref:Reverse transcriptase domain-containing protein n=1 Tax=Acer negundo TaxID=4023 RepID=A0AAD5J7N2_ACENE|nr:hypothetical protein LWI28_021608 [Acer negundo]
MLVAFEILHSMSRKKAIKKGHMAVKIDMNKAYERVEWPFLSAVIRKMNFPTSWINLVMDCISTTTLSFQLNGSDAVSLSPSKGLCQGCSLSPYLFLLCSEAFSSLIVNLERNGREIGIRSSRDSPLISHLLFADDCMLFS